MVTQLGSGALALFGNGRSNSFQPVEFDLSVLATPTQSSTALQPRPGVFTTPRVRAPWQGEPGQRAPEPPALRERLADVRNVKTFVDINAEAVTRAGSDPDLKASFALYRALDQLKTLAEASAKLQITDTERARLDAQFQDGLKEVRDFIATTQTGKLDLLYADKTSRLETVVSARTPSSFQGKAIVNGRGVPVPGVAGTERLTIDLIRTIPNGTATTETVTVDFAQIGGPITLDAVATAINDAVGALTITGPNGPIPKYQTRAAVYRNDDGTFGLTMTGGSAETAVFRDVTAPPSVYVGSSVTPTDGVQVSRLARLDWGPDGFTRAFTTDSAGIDTPASAIAKTIFDADNKPKKIGNITLPAKPDPGPVQLATQTNGTAIDSKGFVYTVGTSAGDFESQRGNGEADVVLRKTDSEGRVIFSRVLSAGGKTEGFAITLDANDNVIVAGRTEGRWGATDAFRGGDSFVAKYSETGDELFRTQLDSFGEDSARAVAVDVTGDIYIAGVVNGGMTGTAALGKDDGYLIKLAGTDGQRHAITRFGSAEKDDVAALAIGTDGAVFVGSTNNGQAVVRRFDPSDLAASPSVTVLGNLGGGRISALAIDTSTGRLVVGGSTRQALGGTETNTVSGSDDGFVATLDAATLSGRQVTYVGGTGTDKITGLRADAGKIYVAGQTTSDLNGTRKGVIDGFVARLDATTGAREGLAQLGAAGERQEAPSLAQTARGPGVLAKLGLRAGVMTPALASDLTSGTTLRAGDYFKVADGDRTPRKIVISDGETVESLVRKLKRAVPGLDAVALPGKGGSRLQLKAQTGRELSFLAGDGDKDALSKLGLGPTRLLDQDTTLGLGANREIRRSQKAGGVFALGLRDGLRLGDKTEAAYATTQLETAIGTVQRAYRSLFFDPIRAQAEEQARLSKGTVPTALKAQLANYQDALRRLGGG